MVSVPSVSVYIVRLPHLGNIRQCKFQIMMLNLTFQKCGLIAVFLQLHVLDQTMTRGMADIIINIRAATNIQFKHSNRNSKFEMIKCLS